VAKGGGKGFFSGKGSPAAVQTWVKANRLRLLAVSSDTRLPQFPEVLTVAEAGVPGYEFRGWVGVLAPAGTPKAIVDSRNAEIKNAARQPGHGQETRILRTVTHDARADCGAHPVRL
jgi:tripartite-type tricarboxylate transporter receptor subunit TctC